MSKIQAIQSKIDAMTQEVAEARTGLADGNPVEIPDVGTRIKEVCDEALALPKEEVIQIQPHLKQLRDDLQELSREMAESEKSANQTTDGDS